MRSITDPANTGPDASPAVKAAAEAKAEDDQAPQKAKAIRYLASRGCGECYPDTEDALLAAMDDCSEVIRYEAVKGLRGSVGESCQCCRENSCCSPKLLKKLYEMAYERDDAGCFLESSARVRRNARLVICSCGGVPADGSESAPIEGPPSGDPAPTPAVDVAPPFEATASDSPASTSPASETTGSGVEPQVAATGVASDLDVDGSSVDLPADLTADQPADLAAGFLLPASFELPTELEHDSAGRE